MADVGRIYQYGPGAESIIVVFESGRPVPREGPLDAGASRPAGTRVKSFKTAEAVTRDGIFIAGPRGSAPDIRQPATHRVPEATGDACNEICPCGDQRC